MSNESTCSNCGATIPAGAPAGQCVKCLLGYAAGISDAEGAKKEIATGEGSTLYLAIEGPGPQWVSRKKQLTGFGDFEFLAEGKEGGMGVVYRARQISLGRIVGLKMIRTGNLASEREVQRFRTEAESAASLDHPHIVPIYEVGEHEGRHYFTMKWIEGQSLGDALGGAGYMGAETGAAKSMIKIARAIQHAHERGILHRDLKPANILLDQQGEPHVTDFGLAKRLEAHPEMTASGAIMGTPSFMSPEQAEGKNKQLTTASDIFSLGGILYQMITGRAPFRGETAIEIIRRVIEDEPARPSALNSGVDHDLETICLKCLQKDPQHRYESAARLAKDLENWIEGKPIAARPVSNWERSWKWLRRHPAISALSGSVVLSVILGLAGVGWQWRRTVETNVRLQSQRADNFLAADKSYLALNTLAQLTRNDPRNRAAAERLVNILNQRVFLLPEQSGASNQFAPPGPATDCFSPDGKLRASRGDDGVSFGITNAVTSNFVALARNAHDKPIRSLRFSPDGLRVISASSDSTAKIWNAHNGTLLHTLPHQAGVNWAEFSPDGSNIVTATEAPDSAARFWDAATSKPSLADRMRHANTVNSAHFSPDGTLIVTASDDGTTRLWFSDTGLPYSEPGRLAKAIDDARFSSDGRVVIVTPEDRVVRAYRPTVGTRYFQAEQSEVPKPAAIAEKTRKLDSFANQFKSKYSGEITCLDLFTNLDLLATASKDKSARLWRARTGEPVAVPMIHDSTVNCVRFSPDGRRLVTSTSGPVTRVRIWNVETGQPLTDPILSDLRVAAVEFSNDGSWIITNAEWKWQLYPISGRAPAWLPRLASAVADVPEGPAVFGTLDGSHEKEREQIFAELRKSLRLSGNPDPLAVWARDFLNISSK